MTTQAIEEQATDERDAREAALEASLVQAQVLAETLNSVGLSISDVLLAADMAGWQRLGGAFGDNRDMPAPSREATVRRSRLYWQQEPAADRSTDLWTDFAFGEPWAITARDQAFQTLIDGVLNAPFNRRVFRRQGWQRSSNHLLADGERWFAFFVKPGSSGPVRVRTFDALEIVEVLANPEDKDEVWYYVRRFVDGDGTARVWVYRDWDFVTEDPLTGALDYTRPRADPHPALRPGSPLLQNLGAGAEVDIEPQPDVYLAQIAINTLGMRGYPKGTSSLEWIREHREFYRDRAALNKALAQYAMKAQVQGGQATVDRIKIGLEANNPGNSTDVRGPRGATWVQNAGVDLGPMEGRSDGASANYDGRALRLMALAAFGIPEHIWGDVSTGNLATAQALQPVLKRAFGSYQGLWMDFMQDMIEHIAGWRMFNGDTTVDIDSPSIFEESLSEYGQALGAAMTAFPVLRQSPELLGAVLTKLGLNNVDEIVEVLEPLLADQAAPPAPGQTPEQQAIDQAVEALREASSAHA